MIYDYPLGVLNFLSKAGRLIGGEDGFGTWKEIYHRKTLDKYSPEQQNKLLETYNTSLGLDEVEMTSTFDPSDSTPISVFGDVKGPDGKPLVEALQGNVPLLRALQGVLVPTEEITKAQKSYKLGIQSVKALLKDTKATYSGEALVGIMHEKRSEALKAMKTQHTQEISELEKALPDISVQLRIAEPADKERLNKQLLANLKKAHAQQEEEFNKAATETITMLHNAAQAQRDRVAFLATLYDNNQAMREQINKIYEEQNGDVDGIELTIETNEVGDKFKFIRLNAFNTLSGRDVAKKEGGYAIEFPNHYFSPKYYNSPHNNLKADMLCLIQASKAHGIKNIKVNLTHPKEERALELARLAYEACRENGYPVENIVINLNGKELKGSEVREALFKGTEARYASTEKRAQKYDAERRAHFTLKQNDREAQQAIKQQLQDLESKLPADPAGTLAATATATAAAAAGGGGP